MHRLAPHDDFIKKLWDVHLACEEEGYAHNVSLGLFRSDYMIHQADDGGKRTAKLKQVEFNTIASSFGGLAAKVSNLHAELGRSVYSDHFMKLPGKQAGYAQLPANISIEGLSKGLAAAHRLYNGKFDQDKYNRCIIIVVQEPERNAFDQWPLEEQLRSSPAGGIDMFRVPFDQILSLTKVDSATRALLYTPKAFPERTYEVTTVYYRAGYSPAEYEHYYEEGKPALESQGWQARLHLERSAAIKCPSVLTHLAGCKKVQQILATPGSELLSSLLNSTESVEAVRDTFMPIHPLDGTPAGQEGRRLALDGEESERYVLKPQREGGGNNIYRRKIPDFLHGQDEEAWAQYILMEMIETPPQRNIILRNGTTEEGGVICELGCYGAVLWDADGKVLYNEEAGTLLRTKGDQSEEGGVAAGFGAVDSPCLVDVV